MTSLLEMIAPLWAGIIDIGAVIFGSPTNSKRANIRFYNTLSGAKETFAPLSPREIKMYTCGPTAYNVAHIGNLLSAISADTTRRALEYNGYRVRQVINITDFGHLSTDGDHGDDKMTKALKREGLPLTLENMRSVAEKYAEIYINDLKALNVDTDSIRFPRASDFIQEQIDVIKTLEQKGYAYRATDGVYFDTAKFPDYGKLGNINLKGLKEGARVAASDEKRNPTDFLLWKPDDKIGWDSPWGKGFPGWHIECSAMIWKTLGPQIDIHSGGIDLMPTHHNNEIAQSESASGKKPFVKYWLHNEFLNLKGERLAKSTGNIISLATVIEHGFHPLALRYLYLGAHYRSPSTFTWEALEAAQKAFLRLVKLVNESSGNGSIPEAYVDRFVERINDDLDTPGALAVLWEMVNDKSLTPEDLRAGLIEFDHVLGLGLEWPDEKALALYRKELGAVVGLEDVPVRVKELLEDRELARMERRWADADTLREEIESEGYIIKDTADGPQVMAKY